MTSRASPLQPLTAALVLAFAAALPAAAQPVDPEDFAPGRVLVTARAGLSTQQADKVFKGQGGLKSRRIGQSNLFVVDVPKGSEKAMANKLAHNPHFKSAELDQRVPPSLAANDPYAGSAWHHSKIGSPTAWDSTQGSGVTIAILDTGVDGSHPDLSGRMVAGYNAYDKNTNTADVHGHGTGVAGAAAATTNNSTGVAAVAGQAHIMPIRITDTSGYAYWSTVAEGLTWAADRGARVANISFVGVAGSSTVQNAAQYMKNKGGLVIVSAGNNGVDEKFTPTTTMIPVSATDSTDTKTSWSSYGSFVAIAAPGQDIWSTKKGGSYGAWWGTSFSSPVVAGTVALMFAAKPSLTSADAEKLLFQTAVDLGAAGRDSHYGYGRVDAAAAVKAALSTSTTTSDTQAPSASISAPLGSSTVSGLVGVNVSAGDNVGVTKVELRVNGALVATDTASPYAFSWDSTKVADGSAKLTAVAFDAAGNAGTSAAVTVNVVNTSTTTSPTDTTPPTVAISNPTHGSKVSGTVSISSTAGDNSGAVSQTLSINGVKVASRSSAGTLSYKWNTRKLAAGSSHTIKAVATDAAGNVTSHSVTVSK